MLFRKPLDEDGATAATFLLSLFALLSLALLAIDGGFLLVSRRGQVADTDSAALAATRAVADDNCLAQLARQDELNGVADRLLRANDANLGATETSRVGNVEFDTTSLAPCPNTGVVTVTSQRPSSMFFAPLFGFDDLRTSVASKVAYGQGNVFEGVRPIGICGSDPHYLTEWLPYFTAISSESTADDGPAALAYGLQVTPAGTDDHPSYPGGDWPTGNGVHRLDFQKLDGTSDCGGAAGNFGFLDFDGNDNQGCEDPDNPSANQLRCRIRRGFEGGVSLGGPPANGDDENCNTEEPSITNCPPEPGQIDSASAALDDVLCPSSSLAAACIPLLIVVYSEVTGVGSNAEFNLESVASIVLRGYNLKSKGKDIGQNFLDIEFVRTIAEGSIAGSAASAPGGTAPLVVQACGTEAFDNC